MKIFTTPVEFHEELVSLGIYMGRYSFPNTKDRIPTCIIIYFVPSLVWKGITAKSLCILLLF